MIKSRSTLAIPPSRPRRIWLNAVGSENGAAREEELKRSLPFCDMETGTKNRVVQRDPITGLGLLGNEFDPLREARSRSQSMARDRGDRNPILGQGDLGAENTGFRRQFSVRCRGEYRNPIDLSGSDSKEPELDILRPNNRPAKSIVRQASRDPIAGRGDFGREWDPIRKYAGRPKVPQAAAPVKDERNPITGSGIPKTSTIELWHRPPDYPFREYLDRPLARSNSVMVHNRRPNRNPLTGEDDSKPTTPRRVIKPATNPLTGENCNSFNVKPEERKQRNRTTSGSSKGSNPLTGEGCRTSDSRPSTPRKMANGAAGGNPLTGDNCQSYDLSAEFRPKPPVEKESKNPLTGENCDSYDLSAESKSRPSTAASAREDRPNPLTGENVNSFDIHQELRSDRGGDRASGNITETAATAAEPPAEADAYDAPTGDDEETF